MSKEERLEYLEEERQKIWAKIVEIEADLKKKTSEYEAEARISAEQAAQFKISSAESNAAIAVYLTEATDKLAEVKKVWETIETLNIQINEYAGTSIENSNSIRQTFDEISAKSTAIQEQIAVIQKLFDAIPTYEANAKNLEEIHKRSSESDSKINALFEAITTRKKEIDEIYYKVFGVESKDGVRATDGMVDELEKAYVELKFDFDETVKQMNTLKSDTRSEYEKFMDIKTAEFTDRINDWTGRFEGIELKVTELLPGAMTKGLSYAYAEKKNAEEEDRVKLRTSFNRGILGLVIVSSLPFAVSVVLLIREMSLEDVLLRMPRMVLAILPLYIPFLWIAYSSNKKINLSKRLIEEYSHKEVLSKTYEGLIREIGNVEDKTISADLRVKLLYNILEVNSENPGKLISDYNKSDHPLMDALEKSTQLTNSVNKLSRVPGLKKLMESLSRKSDAILEEQARKAESGLESLATGNGNGAEMKNGQSV